VCVWAQDAADSSMLLVRVIGRPS